MSGTHWTDFETIVANPRRRLARVAAFSAFGSSLEAAVLVIVARVGIALDDGNDTIGIAGVATTPLRWVLVGCALLVALFVVHLGFAAMAGRFSSNVLMSSRTRLIDAYLRSNLARQTADSEGVLQHAAGTLAEQSAYLAITLAIGVASLANLAIMLIFSGLVSPIATAAVIVIGLALFVALRPIARLTNRTASSFVSANADFGSAVAEQSQLALETSVFGVEAERQHALDEHNRRAGDGLFRSRAVSLAGGFAFRDIALLVLLGGLALVVGNDSIDIAAIGPVLLLNVRALSFAQGVQSARQVLSEHSPNLATLADLTRGYRSDVRQLGTTHLEALGAIELSDVTFRYAPDARPALDGVNLRISPGSSIGVVGPSGGGKSTLAQLLLGVRSATGGSITVDGHDLADIDRASLTRLVAAVPQEARLIEGTIADNVRFFRPAIDDDTVARALEQAGLSDEVASMPKGSNTAIGARGLGVSGGQRQRIAIARALAGGAELLVLDEPTSALDAAAEQTIADTIDRLHGQVTLVVIAHRPLTVERCERVVELTDGVASIVR